MKREKSCGAIVYRNLGENLEILIIKHINGGHWAFPKGHVENNETEVETALREIKEETGLTVKIDNSFREMVTYSPKKNVIKDVIYFAGEYLNGEDEAQPEEVMQIKWVNAEDALKAITYANDKRVLNAFYDYYNEK